MWIGLVHSLTHWNVGVGELVVGSVLRMLTSMPQKGSLHFYD
jgi:hypothetical protein